MAPATASGVVAIVSQQDMLVKATESLLDAVKATGEGPSEFALYLLELLEVSAKISELADVKAAARQTAVSSEAKKWQELSLLTLQFCCDGLHDQQRKLVGHVNELATKGASISRSATTAIATGPSPALPSVSSMLSAVPIMNEREPKSKARTPPPAMDPPAQPKPFPSSVQKGVQGAHPFQQKPRSAPAAGTSPKSPAKGKAKAKQQASKQQSKQAAPRTGTQQPLLAPQLSSTAAEFHPITETAKVGAAAPIGRMPNFDCYDDEV